MTTARISLVAVLAACVPAAAADRQYDFQDKTLANGLRVITLEDFSCPVVAVQVWYHVGSKDENPERQGFAHMFEHMMFRGTDRLGSKDHFELIRRTGGDCNAYTAFDNTTYVNELPANQLELILWLEAERMTFLKIDEDGFYTERKVVEEEKRLRVMNAPYGTVLEKVLATLFKEHPYRWPGIGNIPHLRAATIDELAAFWSKFYVPNNATLVIVGAVKNADAQRLAEKYFSWIPKCPDPPRITRKEPPQTAPRELKIEEKKGPVPIVGYVFRTVPQNHPDQVPLEMMTSILGGGQSSRLYRDLVKKEKLCQVALSGAFALEDDGVAGAGAVMLPVVNDKEKVLQEIDAQIKRMRDEPVTARELEKAKNQMLRGVVTGALTVANKASLLGQAALIYGDPEHLNRRIAEIKAVSAADIQRVAKTYFVDARRTTVRVEPNVGGLLKRMFGLGKNSEEDEGAKPAVKPRENRVAERTGTKATAKRPADFPAKPPLRPLLEEIPQVAHEDKTLPNGLKVVVIPNHEVPYVTMMLGLKYGAWADDPAKPGVAAMTLAMLDKGTKTHSALELDEETEFNAVTLGGSAGMDTASVNASCLTEKVDLATKLLAEIVLTPTFPKDEFKIHRNQVEMGLMISSREPGYIADRELRQRLYGEHPYARTPTGEMADVSKITREDMAAWWNKYARPDTSVLYVAGDVQAKAIFELALQYFGEWKAEGEAPRPAIAAIPRPSTTHIFLVDRPDSVQSQIRVGHTSITRDHPDYHATRVVSQILGGGFNSRLNEAIRVKKGLTYGARGGFSVQRFAGEFVTSTFSKTANTAEAVQTLLDELKKMRDEPPTSSELDVARSYLVGSFAGDRETPQATVGDLWLLEYAGLKPDYFQQALSAYKKTSAADVKRLSDGLIRTDKLTIVVVGAAEELQAELEKIAPVTVINKSGSKSDSGKDKESADATPRSRAPRFARG